MVVKSLEIKNFRNYEKEKIYFSPGTNILYGENAQGKTNILEALYLCGSTKSHRGSKECEMIRHAEEEGHVRTNAFLGEREYQIDIHLKKNEKKGMAINGRSIKRANEIFGFLSFVFFSPEDLNLVKDGPSRRRRFIDMELSQTDPIYLGELSAYNRILKQRNILLKEKNTRPFAEETLAVWDEQLEKYAKRIIERRREFIEKLKKTVCATHAQITKKRERLDIKYLPNTKEENIKKALYQARAQDTKTGKTSVGPHRDELLISIDGKEAKKYASQGQQRTAALSLKLAEIEILTKERGEEPVLLLDDVMSELDDNRKNMIIGQIRGIQTIMTCTGIDEYTEKRAAAEKTIFIKKGKAEEKNGERK